MEMFLLREFIRLVKGFLISFVNFLALISAFYLLSANAWASQLQYQAELYRAKQSFTELYQAELYQAEHYRALPSSSYLSEELTKIIESKIRSKIFE